MVSREIIREQFINKEKLNFTITAPSRGLQLKKGAEESNTKWLLFLHADTELNKKNILEIYNFMSGRNTLKVGFFKLSYRKKKFFGKFNFLLGKFKDKNFQIAIW